MRTVQIKSNKYLEDLMAQYHENAKKGSEQNDIFQEKVKQYKELEEELKKMQEEGNKLQNKASNLATQLLKLTEKEVKKDLSEFEFPSDIQKVEDNPKVLNVIIRDMVEDYVQGLRDKKVAEKKAEKALAKTKKKK